MTIEMARLVQQAIVNADIETPMVKRVSSPYEGKQTLIENRMTQILEILGLNLDDDSLKETPQRVSKMWLKEMFYGLSYENFPKCTVIENRMRYDELIATKCKVVSCCEHHLVPFIGTAWCAYLPKTNILGLSKFNRVVDFFARRPQVQERLTAQITVALQTILETEDVACVIRAQHFCTHIRGVKDTDAITVTSKIGGKFKTVPELRQEFLALTRA